MRKFKVGDIIEFKKHCLNDEQGNWYLISSIDEDLVRRDRDGYGLKLIKEFRRGTAEHRPWFVARRMLGRVVHPDEMDEEIKLMLMKS